MPSSCVVCKGNTSRPENFLLSCTLCNSFWHHRCHKPHIKDYVLVNIVNKFNQDRKTNPAARFAWTCDPCLKKSTSLPEAPILIDDDDDDDIIILDGPPSRPNAQNNPEAFRSTIPTTKTPLSTPHIPEIQVRQAVVPTSTSKSRPIAQSVGHPTAAQGTSKPVVANKASVSSAHHQPPRNPLSTKATGPLGQENGIRIIDDPFLAIPDPPVPTGLIRPGLVQKSSSSGLVSGLVHLSMDEQEMANPDLNNLDDDDDDPLEYVTPPPVTAPLPRESDHPGVGAKTLSIPPRAEIVIQTQSISIVAQEAGLLPSWINARHSAADAEPDLWHRALAARTQTQSATQSNSSTATVGKTQVPGPNVRKKVKAKPLNAAKVERSFSFFADAWMKQTRVGLGF